MLGIVVDGEPPPDVSFYHFVTSLSWFHLFKEIINQILFVLPKITLHYNLSQRAKPEGEPKRRHPYS